jgi:hypothetical protein
MIAAWTQYAECRNAGDDSSTVMQTDEHRCHTTNTHTWEKMQTHVNYTVALTNEIFRQSGVLMELQVVHYMRVTDYTEKDESTTNTHRGRDIVVHASNTLMNATDGIMDDLHVQRVYYGAPIVALFVEIPPHQDDGVCGGAPLGPDLHTLFPIIRSSCAITQLSFAHESTYGTIQYYHS